MVKVSRCGNKIPHIDSSDIPFCLDQIIPQLLLEWQQEQKERGEKLDREWRSLQIEEAEIRRSLENARTTDEVSKLTGRLAEIEQRMGEISLELEHGDRWGSNGRWEV